MQAYLTLGSEVHLRAARNGFDMLQTTQSFATGGWGPDEAFGEPGVGQLGNSLASTHASFETPCGAYGHFKITRYLLRVTKRPATATAWNRCSTTRFWEPGRSSPMEPRSTIPTIT